MLFRQKAQRGRVPQERGPCIFPRQFLRTAKPGFKYTDAQRSASDSSPLALRVQAHAEASTSAPTTSTEILTGSASYDFDGIETCYYDYEYNSQICYLQAGTSGPPLVFIHGFGVGGYHFERAMPALAKHHRVYALDLLGQGRSWPAHPVPPEARLAYSTDTWSAQIQHFIDNVVKEPAYLIGNSLGGYLSIQVASSAPSAVKGLVLLNATPFWGFRPNVGNGGSSSPTPNLGSLLQGLDGTVPISRGVKSVIEKFWWDNLRSPATIQSMIQLVYANKGAADEQLIQRIVDSTKQPGALDAFASIVLSPKSPLDFTAMVDRVSEHQIPVCMAYGREDPWVVPLWGQRLRRQLPSATYLELSPAGHCPHHEAPSAVSRCIHEWVAAQESGQALPLDVGQAWQVRESSQVVQVTHVNGAPRNVFEIFDYWTWRLRMAVQQAVMGQPAQATIDV